jgi:hypothetical protein
VGIPAPAGHLLPGGRAVGRLGAAATQQPPIGQLDPAHAVIAEHVAQGSGDGVEMERASSGQPRSQSQSGPVALDPDTGQSPEPMMLMVVMMRVPPSCLGQLGCEGLAGVMGCVESVGRAVEAWHLSSRLFPAGSRMNTA